MRVRDAIEGSVASSASLVRARIMHSGSVRSEREDGTSRLLRKSTYIRRSVGAHDDVMLMNPAAPAQLVFVGMIPVAITTYKAYL